MKILIVDDDESVGDALRAGLQLHWENIDVRWRPLGNPEPLALAALEADVVLLWAGGTRWSGLDVLREIRRRCDVPVILLAEPDDEMQQVRGLLSGADDCVAKPFSLIPIMARIKATLRRAKLPLPVEMAADYTVGEIRIRLQDQSVLRAGRPVKLTPVEYKLLCELVRNAGRVMPHQVLVDRLSSWHGEQKPEYLRMFIGRLRAKLESPDGPRYIETERRRGYRFVRPPVRASRGATPHESSAHSAPNPHASWPHPRAAQRI